jgi:hypothetical protein
MKVENTNNYINTSNFVQPSAILKQVNKKSYQTGLYDLNRKVHVTYHLESVNIKPGSFQEYMLSFVMKV